jgi:hypothetical protein
MAGMLTWDQLGVAEPHTPPWPPWRQELQVTVRSEA